VQAIANNRKTAVVWKHICSVEQICQTAWQVKFALRKCLHNCTLTIVNAPSSNKSNFKDYFSKTGLKQACLDEAGHHFT